MTRHRAQDIDFDLALYTLQKNIPLKAGAGHFKTFIASYYYFPLEIALESVSFGWLKWDMDRKSIILC